MDERFEEGRLFLKSNWHFVRELPSDQALGVPVPAQEEPPAEGSPVLPLPESRGAGAGTASAGTSGAATGSNPAEILRELLLGRRSRRNFDTSPLSLDELSFLLWACEGVKENRGKYSFRTVPSGGARHPLDLYVFARRVEGLAAGLYRYLPLEHALVLEREGDDSSRLDEALMKQLRKAPCVLFWAAVPYRSEWRYGKAADKLVALDAGHSCQNLYLACEALGLGTCAVGAYDQKKLDDYLGLDGEDLFALYAAPVGRPAKGADEE